MIRGRPSIEGDLMRARSATRLFAVAMLTAVVSSVLPQAQAAPSTGASAVDYAQCANGAPGVNSTTCPEGWINGILQASNSHYFEDQVTPQRLMVLVPKGSPTTNRTIALRYQTRKGTTHAYDSLTSWDLTQTNAPRCDALPNCPGGAATFKDIPADPTPVPPATNLTAKTSDHQLAGHMTMFGGTLTAVSVPVHDNAAGTGDDYAKITVTYSVPSTTTARYVQLLFGGHLAASQGDRGWGTGLGSSNISGGPYHIKWDSADGASVGNRDNQIMGAAILAQAAPAFDVTKIATPTPNPAVPGGSILYTINVKNTGTGAGATPVVDTYDSRLTNIGNITPNTGVHDAAAHTITWQSGTIEPGATKTFSFTATLPSSFATAPESAGTCAGAYSIVNTVTVTGDSATVTTCVAAAAKFDAVKTAKAVPSPAVPGGTIEYTVTVKNIGTAPGSTPVTDSYDSRLGPITAITPATGVHDATAHTVTWQSGTINPGDTKTFTFTAGIPSTFATGPTTSGPCAGGYALVNNVTVTGDSDSTTTCVNAAATWDVEKTATPVPNPAVPGGSISYSITVTNTGTAPGSTPVVDSYDARLINIRSITPNTGTHNATDHTVTWASGTINPGDSKTFSFLADIPATFTGDRATSGSCSGGYAIINNVTVTGDSDSTTTCVSADPVFDVDKVASPSPSPAVPGGDVTYTITVKNTGTGPGSTPVVDTYDSRLTNIRSITPAGGVLDTDAHTVTWASGTINPGDTKTFSFVATFPTTFSGSPASSGTCAGSYPVINGVTVTGDSASVTTCVSAAPSFTPEKTATPDPDPAVPGGTITYSIKVTNTGTGAGSTPVNDTYDARLTNITAISPVGGVWDANNHTVTWASSGQLDPGQSATFSFTATLPASFSGPRETSGPCDGQYEVINSVTVTGGSDSVSTCVNAAPAFTPDKTATPNPNPAIPGGDVLYSITVTNTGTGRGATPVVDTYDAGLTNIRNITPNTGVHDADAHTITWQSGDIDPGQSATFSFLATLPSTFSGDPAATGDCAGKYEVVNSVTVTGGSDSVTTCVAAPATFLPEKTATPNPDPAIPGGDILYSIKVTNTGTGRGSTPVTDTYDSRLTNIRDITPTSGVNDATAHTVTWADSGPLDPGESATFTFLATLPTSFTGARDTTTCPGAFAVVNTVAVTGASDDVTTCVVASPELTLAKVADVTGAGPDELVTYTLTYSNTGSGPATGAVITDDIPADTTFESCTDDCDVSEGVVTWELGTIEAGATDSVQLVVRVLNTVGCQVCNQAALSSADFNGGVATQTENVCIDGFPGPRPDLANASGAAQAATINLSVPATRSTISPVESSQSGIGVDSDNNQILEVFEPQLHADVLRSTSTSVVSGEAVNSTNTSTAEAANLNLNNGLVTAEVVRGVATTIATGSSSAFSSAGSTIKNLIVNAVPVPDSEIRPNLNIELPSLVFGEGSYVAVYEESGSTQTPTGTNGGTYSADESVTMIHLHITDQWPLQAGNQPLDIQVAHAESHSDFPQTTVCDEEHRSVGADAFVASVLIDPLTEVVLGATDIPRTGGDEALHIEQLGIPDNNPIIQFKAGDSHSSGQLDPLGSKAFAQVADLCLLPGCIVKATALTSAVSSFETENGLESDDSETSLLVTVGDQNIGDVEPNTVIELPGLGFLVLREEFCDGSAPPTDPITPCAGQTSSGLTVRAIHLVVTVPDNALNLEAGIQVIVASAHTDAATA
jgi:uncharacterized repeat protein (TIGR01451 family)